MAARPSEDHPAEVDSSSPEVRCGTGLQEIPPQRRMSLLPEYNNSSRSAEGETMNERDARKSRVVSMGQYLRYIGTRAGLGATGGLLCILGAACLLAAGAGLVMCVFGSMLVGWKPMFHLSLGACAIGLAGPVSWSLCLAGRNCCVAASKLDPVVPFTRQNAAALPAEKSLVRPSTSPGSLLLRPTAAEDGLPGQLLHPADGTINCAADRP